WCWKPLVSRNSRILAPGSLLSLLLSQNQINDPAPANVLPNLAAVIQHLGVIAARIFQRIRQNWQPIEASLVVDRLGQTGDCGGLPGGVPFQRRKRVSHDIS